MDADGVEFSEIDDWVVDDVAFTLLNDSVAGVDPIVVGNCDADVVDSLLV